MSHPRDRNDLSMVFAIVTALGSLYKICSMSEIVQFHEFQHSKSSGLQTMQFLGISRGIGLSFFVKQLSFYAYKYTHTAYFWDNC